MSLDLNLISAYSIIAPILIGAIYLRSYSLVIRLLFFFVCLTGVLELASGIFMAYGINNLVFFHVHVYLEFTFIALIFFLTFDSITWRAITLGCAAIFYVYSAFNAIFYEAVDLFNSNQRYVEGLMILFFCTGYFISLMRRPVHRYLEKQPMFWLTSGFLIYFAGTLYLFLVSKELMAINKLQYWTIHSVLNIGLNAIYVLAFLKERKL